MQQHPRIQAKSSSPHSAARKTLQTVPVAITVVGGDTLRSSNINGTETLDRVVPSLTFKRGTANVNSAIAIRGIGTQTFASGAEPSVSAVIDGVVYGRSGMATQDFADIDRIEVLRGPQGTLFGKNASAGALNITSKSPGTNFAADVSAAYYDRNEFRLSGSVSGPLGDHIRALVSGYYGKYDGSAYNVFSKSYVNGYEHFGFKGKVIADLGDVTLTLAGDSSHNNDNCCGDILGTVIASTTSPTVTSNAQWLNLVLPGQLPVVPGPNNRQLNNNFTPGTVDTNRGVSLTVDWKLGNHTLTSISAYRQWKNRQLRDGDFGSISGNYVAVTSTHIPANAATQLIDQRDDGSLDFNQYSEELRLASPSGGVLEYVIGAFIWRTKENDTFVRSDSFCADTTLPADSTGFFPCTATTGTFVTSSGPAAWTTKFQNTAGFGQATVNVSDTFKIIAGLRYTHDEVNYSIVRTNVTNGVVAGANLYPGIQGAFSFAESASANGLSGKAGVQWQATPNIMAYATYSRGYKGPALNVFYSENKTASVDNTGPIAPERSDAEELGVKIRAFDRKLTLNAALYNQVLDNFQANSFVTQGVQTFVTLTNAGRVRSRGFEMDFSLRPVEGVTLSGGYTYNEGTIRQYNCNASALTSAQLTTCLAHNGQPLPFAPKHKLNVNADWKIPVTDALVVRLNGGVSYSSRINFDIDQNPLAQQAPYALVDGQIALQSANDRWSIALIGKNLTDKFYTSFITPVGTGTTALSYQRLQVPRDAQRYFGVRASFKY